MACKDDGRHTLLMITHGGIIDAHLFAAGQMHGDATLGAGCQAIPQPDIGKGAAHHHLMIAAP